MAHLSLLTSLAGTEALLCRTKALALLSLRALAASFHTPRVMLGPVLRIRYLQYSRAFQCLYGKEALPTAPFALAARVPRQS